MQLIHSSIIWRERTFWISQVYSYFSCQGKIIYFWKILNWEWKFRIDQKIKWSKLPHCRDEILWVSARRLLKIGLRKWNFFSKIFSLKFWFEKMVVKINLMITTKSMELVQKKGFSKKDFESVWTHESIATVLE